MLLLFLFVKCRSLHDFGSSMFFEIVHGPGPMRFDTTSERSSSEFTVPYSAEPLNASISSDSSGRSGCSLC